MTENEKPKSPWVEARNGVIEIYGNQMHITWTLDDVRVRIAQLVTDPTHPNPGPEYRGVTEERAAITFSWRGAKILRDNLTAIIDAYEQQNGEIKVNPALVQSKS